MDIHETLIHTLLNADAATILSTLKELDSATAREAKDALVLLWQIHPDEEIKDKTLEYLSTLLEEAEKHQIEKTFSIFSSIMEYLPWMGDYTDLQAENFAAFEKGKTYYEPILVASSILVEYYLDLGRKLYMMFDLVEEAQVCFEGIVRYAPQNDEALYALGRLAERSKDMEAALNFYNDCTASNPSHIYGLLQMGILKATTFKDYEGAIDCYNKVIELEPFMAETHVRIAEAHYALKDIKRARQFIDIALGINEYQEEALNLLGQIQWHDDENIGAAIETFEKGLDHPVHGDSGLLLASLGDLHNTHLGEYDKARIYYEKSLKAAPHNGDTLRKLVTILENIYQDYGAISMCYEAYLVAEKADASLYVDYANFLIKYMHDYAFAKIQLDQALEMEANNEMALKLLRQIEGYLEDDFDDEDDNIDFDDDDFDDDDDDDDDFVGGGAAGDN
ncbi:lipopolysaccharide assembly protein LapB [Aureispira sp. CCB-QB1]|uniref:tetratricopeptide repeat protein n=1 Tax=Aureispira sp. CCB-QB1 TaxID=1313421 RepID=UPI000696820B|nr:tetratricopeptide repeat protein [Aureispira sp. CCB-QB1]